MVDFAPLTDFLKGSIRDFVKSLMIEAMPILAAPNLKEEQLIDQLIDRWFDWLTLGRAIGLSISRPTRRLINRPINRQMGRPFGPALVQ